MTVFMSCLKGSLMMLCGLCTGELCTYAKLYWLNSQVEVLIWKLQ